MVQHQIEWNEHLCEDNPDITNEYMDFVQQFGYIVLFSSCFPLAGFFCFIANFILIRSVMNEFKYNRRPMPEISIGIGQFLYMIEFLSHCSIVINIAICYFTSQTYKTNFVDSVLETT